MAALVSLVVGLPRPKFSIWTELAVLPRLTAGFPDNADWDGNPDGPLTRAQIAKISRWDTIEVLPKFDANFNIQQQFNDARRLLAAARRRHRHLAVYAYFSAAFWFNANAVGWGNYGRSFRRQWLLRDAQGRPIPYYGAGNASAGTTPDGYMLDLRRADYRAWAVRTIVSWLKEAPLAGIAVDNADPLPVGMSVPANIAGGPGGNYQQLLCGTTALNCPVLTAWNSGLRDLLKEMHSALHQLGDKVLYNGIAPTIQHGFGRNLRLLRYTDGTSNEAFCFKPLMPGYPLVLTDPVSDVRVMQRIAAENQIVLEIADSGGEPNAVKFGPYCFGIFLMGWQPGHAFFVFHSGYNDPIAGRYPEVWQQRIDLGPPVTGPQFHGDIIVRRFALGFVIVNTGYRTGQVPAPSDGVQYSVGRVGRSLSRGEILNIRPHSAVYAIEASWRS